MKRYYFALVVLVGLSLSMYSCKQKEFDNSDGDGKNEPKNIQEVDKLLHSAGRLLDLGESHIKSRVVSEENQGDEMAEFENGQRGASTKMKQTIEVDYLSNAPDFAVLDPWPTVLWPGCLIQGNSLRGHSVPTAIPLYTKRRPGRIALQIVSGADSQIPGEDGEGVWYEDVQVMRETNVLQAQNKLLKRFRESGVPASVAYNMTIVHNVNDLAIATGLDIKKAFGKISATFGTSFKAKKSYVLVKLYQRFYTLSYEDPEGFKGVFNEDIQKSDLAPYTGPGNPICYVSSVSYGRVYYLLYESEEKSNTLFTALNSSFAGIKVNGAFVKNDVVSKSKVTLIQRGGDAQAGLEGALDPNKVADFIIKGSIPSPKNVGAPISFTIKHLYDNSLVNMGNTLKYKYDKVQFIPKTKNNNVTFYLRDISVRTEASGKWQVSNHGEVKLVDAKVIYKNNSGKREPKILPFYRKDEHLPVEAITYNSYMAVNRVKDFDCDFDGKNVYNLVTLQINLSVIPAAWKRGSKNIPSPKEVVLSQDFYFDGSTWKALNNTESSQGSIVFHELSTVRSFDPITFRIKANYSMFVDNILMGE